MTEFLNDPIQTLLDRCDEPVAQIDLFTPGIFQTVISGQEVNDFVYAQHNLWDYSQGREAFRAAFGSTYLTLLSGQEYHTKQKEIQRMLRTDASDEQFTDRIKFFLFNRYGRPLSAWARELAIDLIWTSLFPCTPVARNLWLLSEFENAFQESIGLESFSLPWMGEVSELLGAKDPMEFADRSLPFIAGIRALSTMIEWVVIYHNKGLWPDRYMVPALRPLCAPPGEIVRKTVEKERPPFLLFPLYPSKDFILDWKKFEEGKLIFHAFVLPLLRGGNDVHSIFGGGQHICPGRHLVRRFVQLLAVALSNPGSANLEGPVRDEYKFNGLLVPKFEHRFL